MSAGLARAEGEPTGVFDYYVLSLSWSPAWCELEGEARNSPQCDRDLGWVLHGLWPQYRRGYPSWCFTDMRDPTRVETAQMGDIMGTAGSAWHQWKKHGRCSGLSARDFFALSRRAYETVVLPPVFDRINRDMALAPSVIEAAFLAQNPVLSSGQVTVLCDGERITEVRICLAKDLSPRDCGYDVAQDCSRKSALLDGR
jgi:ribonuclease T2